MKRLMKRKTSKKAKRAAVRQRDAIDALVTAGAQSLGLTLEPAWRASVKLNLQLILSHSARVEGFPLYEETEPGPIFHA